MIVVPEYRGYRIETVSSATNIAIATSVSVGDSRRVRRNSDNDRLANPRVAHKVPGCRAAGEQDVRCHGNHTSGTCDDGRSAIVPPRCHKHRSRPIINEHSSGAPTDAAVAQWSSSRDDGSMPSTTVLSDSGHCRRRQRRPRRFGLARGARHISRAAWRAYRRHRRRPQPRAGSDRTVQKARQSSWASLGLLILTGVAALCDRPLI
jgi:hypothetical protein